MTDIPAISGSSTGTWKSLVNAVISLINGKFNSRPYIWANATARTAQTGMTIGEYGYQTDTQVTYRATSATATQPWASPWITWAPTLSNITLGTASSTAYQYKYSAGLVHGRYKIILGTSGMAIGTNPSLTLPVTAVAPNHANAAYNGRAVLYDNSATTNYNAAVRADASSATVVILMSQSATVAAITASAPFIWAASDVLEGDFIYEAA